MHLNKYLVSWNHMFCTDVRPKEPVRARELSFVNKQNRFIIRDNNSLE